MQNFSLHAHSKTVVFDADNSVLEMAIEAEKKGFEVFGISNHLHVHPNVPQNNTMSFRNPAEAIVWYQRVVDEIREAAAKVSIPLLIGFEVDFYPSVSWRNTFEKILKKIPHDYLIGATHVLRTPDESVIYGMHYEPNLADLGEDIWLSYFENVEACIKSGYFDWIAHIDLPKQFFPGFVERYFDRFCHLADVLEKHKTAVELNTGGLRRKFIGELYPAPSIIDELKKRKVKLLISDDSHRLKDVGAHFKEAEEILENYPYRFKTSDLKKRKG